MYAEYFTPQVENLIRGILSEGAHALDTTKKVEDEKKLGDTRDPVEVYEQLFGDETNTKHMANNYNSAAQLAQENRGRLEQLEEDASWDIDMFVRSLCDLEDALPKDSMAHRDLVSLRCYVFQPDYEAADSDYYKPLKYRMEQAMLTLKGLLDPDGRKERQHLLERAHALNMRLSFYGLPAASLWRRVDQFEMHNLTSKQS
jgi:hypothetical protein